MFEVRSSKLKRKKVDRMNTIFQKKRRGRMATGFTG